MVLFWVLVQGVRAALVHFGIDSACPQKFWLWWWREFSLVCIYTHMRHHSPVCNWPPPILGVRHWYFFCRSYLPWVLWSTISGWWNWGALFSGKVLLFGGNIHFLGSDDLHYCEHTFSQYAVLEESLWLWLRTHMLWTGSKGRSLTWYSACSSAWREWWEKMHGWLLGKKEVPQAVKKLLCIQ